MSTGKVLQVVRKEDGPDGTHPAAIFLEDAESVVTDFGAEASIQALKSAQNSFRMTQGQFLKFIANMEAKIPEIEKTLELIEYLNVTKDEPSATNFSLIEGVFCEAEVEEKSKVFLWLGANLMVEYSLEEAREVLEKSLANAKKNLATYQKDLLFIGDQITILEVNVARVYNANVKMQKAAKKA